MGWFEAEIYPADAQETSVDKFYTFRCTNCPVCRAPLPSRSGLVVGRLPYVEELHDLLVTFEDEREGDSWVGME